MLYRTTRRLSQLPSKGARRTGETSTVFTFTSSMLINPLLVYTPKQSHTCMYIIVSIKTIHGPLSPFLYFRGPCCCCCATAANISRTSASFPARSAASVAAALWSDTHVSQQSTKSLASSGPMQTEKRRLTWPRPSLAPRAPRAPPSAAPPPAGLAAAVGRAWGADSPKETERNGGTRDGCS